MSHDQADSRYLTLWICVILSAAIIFVGWMFAIRYNFQKIDESAVTKDQAADQASAQVEQMFTGVDKMINQGSADVNAEIAKQKEALKTQTPAAPVVPEDKVGALPAPEVKTSL